MRNLTDQSALEYSTFRFDKQLSLVTELGTLADLEHYQPDTAPLILGEGSNTVFLHNQTKPICRFVGKDKTLHWLDDNYAVLHVEAGHNWHQLVQWVVEQKLWGLENLALIPGSVGAAPVQNIGAYGVELADVCLYVDFYRWQTKSVERIAASRCKFSYRDSIFKHAFSGQGLIVAVGMLLQKRARPVLNYSGLDKLPADSAIEAIFQQVISVRQAKLPDPTVLPNCGSFFKNPVISAAHYRQLQQQFPLIPGYSDGKQIKVPAAWLIEQQGFKGRRNGDIGCYLHQPLVLVNYGDGTSEQLLELVTSIQLAVASHYQIELEPEVRMLAANGNLYDKK